MQMREIWEFALKIHEIPDAYVYDETRLPVLFLHVVGKLENRLMRKMMQQGASVQYAWIYQYMYMYLYMYIYTDIYIYTHVYIYMYKFIYMCIYI